MLVALCFVGTAFSQTPMTCQNAGSFNTPVQCSAAKPRNIRVIVKDESTCDAWCFDQCGPSGTTGGRFSVGGVCSCRYPRSQRGNQDANTQLGVCLFKPQNIGVSGPCLEAVKTDSMTDMTNETRSAWINTRSQARSHTQVCDADPKCQESCR